MRNRVKWDCGRAIARADVEQRSLRFELKADPDRLHDQASHQVCAGEGGQINLGTPTCEFTAIANESFFLRAIELDLKVLEFGIEKFLVVHYTVS